MRKSALYLALCATSLTLLPGCVPSLSGDAAKEMADFQAPQTYGPNLPAQTEATAPTVAQLPWKDFFPDPQLQGLIDTALAQSQELRILEQDITIANNEISARQGEYLPSVGVGASYEQERVGKFTSQGVSDEANELPSVLRNREAGLYTRWEVDIWKRLRNAKQSAYYEYLASIEGRKFAQTRLIAEIASTYYELEALDQQLAIVKRYIDTLQRAQQVVQYQMEAAQANALAVNRFAAEVQKNQSLQFRLQQDITVAENRLNALVGRFPQPLERHAEDFLAKEPPALQSGLPANLLENRPDIQQATYDLKAAELNVSVAKARFYPSLSLDAGLGFQSFNGKYFLNSPESLFYNVAASLTAPLLNRLAIEADYRSANSRQLQAVYEYQKTVIDAYVEVINQLNAVANLKQTFADKQAQVASLDKAIEDADVLFKAARIDYLEALLTQRDALEAQMELVENKQQLLGAYVNLYRALGGGWQDPTPAATPTP
jgi:NodT family efflux transporter outer membrane factor (OMF) lipoprotein